MYEYRTLTTTHKRTHLAAQLMQAEHDLFVHSTNAALHEAAGDDVAAAEQQSHAERAQAVAEVTAALLDELPIDEALGVGPDVD